MLIEEVVKGLTILKKYIDPEINLPAVMRGDDVCCIEGTMFAGPRVTKTQMTPEDKNEMLKARWYIDAKTDSWAKNF